MTACNAVGGGRGACFLQFFAKTNFFRYGLVYAPPSNLCLCVRQHRKWMDLVGMDTNSSVDLFGSGEGLCLPCDCHILRTLWQTRRRLGLLCGS